MIWCFAFPGVGLGVVIWSTSISTRILGGGVRFSKLWTAIHFHSFISRLFYFNYYFFMCTSVIRNKVKYAQFLKKRHNTNPKVSDCTLEGM